MLTTPQDFVDYNGGSGNYRAAAVSTALAMAEAFVENILNTPLEPTQVIEEHQWPHDGKLPLDKVRVIDVEAVTYLHTVGCDCSWDTDTGCASLVDGRTGLVYLSACSAGWSKCGGCRCPRRVRLTYNAGFQAAESNKGTVTGEILRGAIMVAALGYLQTAIGLDARGNEAVGSWSSVGYSESKQFNERDGSNELVHPLFQQADQMLKPLKIRRPIQLRRKSGAGWPS